MKIFNSLTKRIEEFRPINPPKVGVYTCGPTVYDYATIGNWRTYTLGDLLVRTLSYLGFKPEYIMNLTDVGHLTGDNLGDADIGEDRLEKAALKERKTAWEISEFYSNKFLREFDKMNFIKPRLFAKATDHLQEQIELIEKIYRKGLAYKITDGLYFDVGGYEKAGYKYGELSSLDRIMEGARVEPNPEKRDPRDFALWKFSPQDKKRDMEWESPWGKGFPGWHIECSAMSIKYLGEQFDFHVGGEDLRSIHHPNEIVQSEAATGKRPFVKYWLHGAFLLIDGGRMGKSLGNAYTLKNIEEKDFSPLDLRYFYLTGHYRKQLNFTWKGLEAARSARQNLNKIIANGQSLTANSIKDFRIEKGKIYREKFIAAVSDDLNMPKALAVVWEFVHAPITQTEKLALLLDFDKVLGLGLADLAGQKDEEKMPQEILVLLKRREELREKKQWEEADQLRKEIESKGYQVEDIKTGLKVKKTTSFHKI